MFLYQYLLKINPCKFHFRLCRNRKLPSSLDMYLALYYPALRINVSIYLHSAVLSHTKHDWSRPTISIIDEDVAPRAILRYWNLHRLWTAIRVIAKSIRKFTNQNLLLIVYQSDTRNCNCQAVGSCSPSLPRQ